MRNPARIDEFTKVLNYIWKNKCPDWRFFQLTTNVFGGESGLWFMEENKTLDILCNYFATSLEEVKNEIILSDGKM